MHEIWPLDIVDIVVVATENMIEEMKTNKKGKKMVNNGCGVAISMADTGR